MYTLEEIATTLRQARAARGLSQRALSAKTGLTQTHISKIENAAVDLRLSNLLELARALELEVMLVPRKAVPATQGLVRALEGSTRTPEDFSQFIRGLARAAKALQAVAPDAQETQRLAELAKAFQGLHLTDARVQAIRNYDQALRDATPELQRLSQSLLNSLARNDDLQKARLLTDQLDQVRNAIVRAGPTESPASAKPAYRLDEDGIDHG